MASEIFQLLGSMRSLRFNHVGKEHDIVAGASVVMVTI